MYFILHILVCAPELDVFRLYTLRLFIRMVHCISTHRRRNIFTSMRSTSSMHSKYIICTYFSIYIHIYIYIMYSRVCTSSMHSRAGCISTLHPSNMHGKRICRAECISTLYHSKRICRAEWISTLYKRICRDRCIPALHPVQDIRLLRYIQRPVLLRILAVFRRRCISTRHPVYIYMYTMIHIYMLTLG